MLKKIIVGGVIIALTGCASSAHDRRMADAEGESNTGKYVAAGLGLLAIGALTYAAGQNTGAGYAPAPTTDYDWDWDLQAAPYGGQQWICRGVQTARYAEMWRCASKLKTDQRWPNY